VRKRYSKNFSGSIHYTWAKALAYTGGDIGATFQGDATSVVQDFFNWRAERGPATGDITHYVAAEALYDLPGFDSVGVVRHAIGKWQLSTIFRAQTGEALTIGQPSGISASRPDYIGGNPIRPDYRKTLVYLNTAVFQAVPKGAVSGATLRPGNIGSGSIRGPGLWNVDLSIGKNFQIREQMRLQIRADMFNA
jgi:hypothetical protein